LLESGTFIGEYPAHADFLPLSALASAAAVGLSAGVFALLLTLTVYYMEDLFHHHLGRLHWMWWPALGGLIVGLGGYFQPRALGIGKDVIEDLVRGHFAGGVLTVL